MGRTNQTKVRDLHNIEGSLKDTFVSRVRLNLNDLLKRRQEEKNVDKKTNLLIFSGTVAVAAVVGIILSL
jgi:hypothetical protein